MEETRLSLRDDLMELQLNHTNLEYAILFSKNYFKCYGKSLKHLLNSSYFSANTYFKTNVYEYLYINKKWFKIFYKDYFQKYAELTWNKCKNESINYFQQNVIKDIVEISIMNFFKDYKDIIFNSKYYNSNNSAFTTTMFKRFIYHHYKINKQIKCNKNFVDIRLTNSLMFIHKEALKLSFIMLLTDKRVSHIKDENFNKLIKDIYCFNIKNATNANKFMFKTFDKFIESTDAKNNKNDTLGVTPFWYNDSFFSFDAINHKFTFVDDEKSFIKDTISKIMTPYQVVVSNIESIDSSLTSAFVARAEEKTESGEEFVKSSLNHYLDPFDVSNMKTSISNALIELTKVYDKNTTFNFVNNANQLFEKYYKDLNEEDLKSVCDFTKHILYLMNVIISIIIGNIYYIANNDTFETVNNKIKFIFDKSRNKYIIENESSIQGHINDYCKHITNKNNTIDDLLTVFTKLVQFTYYKKDPTKPCDPTVFESKMLDIVKEGMKSIIESYMHFNEIIISLYEDMYKWQNAVLYKTDYILDYDVLKITENTLIKGKSILNTI